MGTISALGGWGLNAKTLHEEHIWARYAETANVDYCLSFADQGKQTYTYCSLFLFAANKRKLPFSVSSIFPILIY
jgi:hypothetical protein